MAIRKLPSGNYQARLEGVEGKILSKTFLSRIEAQRQVLAWRQQKKESSLVQSSKLKVDEFYQQWCKLTLEDRGSGWISLQKQQYRDYVSPVIGSMMLSEVGPNDIRRVLKRVIDLGRSPQLCRHVYVLTRKFFNDAIEDYQYLTQTPVLRKMQPALSQVEAQHLNLNQIRRLLEYVDGKKYGLEIWTQLYLGLRVGELIALKWRDLDLDVGRVNICRTFVRKTGQIREYPKGRKHHRHSLPKELWQKLKAAHSETGFVFTSPVGNEFILPYRWYLTALKKYCREAGVPVLSTHGLRHSASEIFLSHGATHDDLRQLFAHASPSTTQRYIHGRGTSLESVIAGISLFGKTDHENRPRSNN